MRSCLILPTYNEAGNLERLVSRIRALEAGIHILVVDDSSPDGTGNIADELARGRPDMSVLHRTGRRRYGDALTEGMRVALSRGFDAVVTMDCDFSHDPAAIPSLLEALGDRDVAIGSRYVAGGQLRAWPRHRRWLSAGANAFVRMLFDLPARDCTSGYRAYRRAVVDSIPWRELNSQGYSCLVELLFWAVQRRGAQVREVPIVFTERRAGKSKMGLREIFGGALSLLVLRARLPIGRRRLRLASGRGGESRPEGERAARWT
jgi:glycosyltransferase involved in cell wall biosynthesis